MPAKREDWNWETLERQDWHLWILAVLLLFVLGISLLTFMFPSAFWLRAAYGEGGEAQRAFFGFSILLALTLVYMLQRQATIRRLKRSLYLAEVAAAEAEQRAVLMAYSSLPELGQFRDSLAMEYRRASHAGDSLAVILVDLARATPEGVGRAAQELRNLLRPRESLFRLSERGFGLILPGMRLGTAKELASQIRERVGKFSEDTTVSDIVAAYPEQAGSLAELESSLRSLVHQ